MPDGHYVKVYFKLKDFFDIDWSREQYDHIVGRCFQLIPPELIKKVVRSLRLAKKKAEHSLSMDTLQNKYILELEGRKINLLCTRKRLLQVYLIRQKFIRLRNMRLQF